MIEQGYNGPHGLGAIMSPPDDRDFQLADALAASASAEEYAAWVPPAIYAAPNMPPVLNQGDTPMCVAYSSSTHKAWQDRIDQGRFYDFDEPYFFRLIGGGPTGAVIRNAFDRMRLAGYPVVSVGQASLHRIAAYYAVTKAILAIQTAIHAFGPITLGVQWFNSWFYPYDNGVLRTPDYVVGGHAIIAYGWDARGLRLRNSWGTGYGLNGDVFMPWWMVLSGAVGEIWKSVDVIDATCKAHVSDMMYPAPRVAVVPAGHTVIGYSELKPNTIVTRFTAPATRGSSFHVDRKRTVSWPTPCVSSTVPHGTFLRGTDGVFAGLLVIPSAVVSGDGKAW